MNLRVLRRAAAFILAATVMVTLGAAAHSYFVQVAWSTAAGQADGIGPVTIPLADRVSWAVHDVGGMLVPYAASTSITLLIGFLVAGALARFTGRRVIVFGLAGAVAIYALFTALKFFLGTVGIFGARGPMGLAVQMAVGLIAGMLFAKLTPRIES